MDLLRYTFVFLLWNCYSYFISIKSQDKESYSLSRNIFSATHAYSCVPMVALVLYGMLSYKWVIYWSTAYFISDTIPMLLFNKYNVITIAYIIHHIIAVISLYSMNYDQYRPYVLQTVFIAEISNFPLYIVYYLKKKKSNRHIYHTCLGIETVHYSILRIIGLGYCFYHIVRDFGHNYAITFGCTLIYGMGLIWSHKLITSYFGKGKDMDKKIV